MNRKLLFITLLVALGLSSCSKTDTPVQVADTRTPSFKLLQQKIITPVCAQCHTAGAQFAIESELILDPTVAYANLVGIKSHQKNASADGLLRIKKGFADSSLFYLKVHGAPNGKSYGNIMPLGYAPLSSGQQKFIHDWINAGAPDTGVVADATLLDDTTKSPVADFVPLPPPTAGTGYQVSIGKFDVAPNFEREVFEFRKLGNTQPIFVNRIHSRIRTNSHHLALYAYPQGATLPQYDKIRDIRNPDGTYNYTELTGPDRLFIGGSMIEEQEYSFPPGVALPLPANIGIDVNTHFINRTNSKLPGECYANFYTVNPSEVKNIAVPFFNVNNSLNLPAGKQTVVSDNGWLNPNNKDVNVFLLTSHNHEWGQKYQIYIQGGTRNGELVYESRDWAQPAMQSYDPPIVLHPGEGLRSVVTYFNNTDHKLIFGLKSTDEMDVIYGYYY
ncbi:MAG: hypothetical protein WCH46_04630 [bacterium]